MTLSDDERRALALIAALLVLASGARWLERPQRLLADAPDVDLAALEDASRSAKPAAGPKAKSPIAEPTKATQKAPAPPATPTETRIDPNTATAEQLVRIPGVGPSLAQRIIEERERGRYMSVHDLERVRGIGSALAKRMAAHVTLPAAPQVPARAPITTLTPVQTPPPAPLSGGAPGALELNAISTVELQKVPGVGPVLAARILARRDSLGRYSSWEEVDGVPGVGPAMLQRLKAAAVLRP